MFSIFGFLALILLFISSFFAEVTVNTNINLYNDYIGPTAKEEYRDKWEMKEDIFPERINNPSDVLDYKMVYYNPWDAQYLSYLEMRYDEDAFLSEVARLEAYGISEYLGYYGVTGFSKYQLLAMEADSYNGFVYAITDGKERIIYVELIFCNYEYDIKYLDYIEEEYLPDGFDATYDNPYEKKMMELGKE